MDKEKLTRPLTPYVGNKYKLLDQILPLFPTDIDVFYDLFAGSCVVTANTNATKYVVNDINPQVVGIIEFLQSAKIDDIISVIEHVINEYDVNNESGEGFYKLRSDYNIDRSPIKLIVLSFYSFNSLLRFNSKGEFNASFGKLKNSFTEARKEMLIEFYESIFEKDIEFCSKDFRKMPFSKKCDEVKFVYADPPYLNSGAQYNSSWTEKEEHNLYKMLDDLSSIGYKFALSNCIVSGGKKNKILEEWSKKYIIHCLDTKYSNWQQIYNDISEEKVTKFEILVTNY